MQRPLTFLAPGLTDWAIQRRMHFIAVNWTQFASVLNRHQIFLSACGLILFVFR